MDFDDDFMDDDSYDRKRKKAKKEKKSKKAARSTSLGDEGASPTRAKDKSGITKQKTKVPRGQRKLQEELALTMKRISDVQHQ